MVEHGRDLAARAIPFIFDPGQGLPMFSGPELLEMSSGAAAVTLNDYEARVVEQKTGKPVAELARIAGAVVVTCGAQGCVIITSGAEVRVPAVPAEGIVDPTGCGDAFRAGLLYGMARDWGWRKSAELASVMGSIKIAHRGGQNHHPGRESIERRFKETFGHTL
jgi:adenosine kinase